MCRGAVRQPTTSLVGGVPMTRPLHFMGVYEMNLFVVGIIIGIVIAALIGGKLSQELRRMEGLFFRRMVPRRRR
jgi:hypothetical protein